MRVPEEPTAATQTVTQALESHGPALRAYVARRVMASDVDDVMQAAALKALERASSLRDARRVRGWLFQIHRNAMRDVHRLRRELASSEELCADEPEERGCRCILTQLDSVAKPYADVLRLVHDEEHSVSEAARVLGISPSNASVRLHRGRKALRQQLLEHCGVTSIRECNGCRCIPDGCCAA